MNLLLTLIIALPLVAATPQTPHQKTLYAVGEGLARDLAPYQLKAEELQWVLMGLNETASGKTPHATRNAYKSQITAFMRGRRDARANAYLLKAAKAKGVRRLPSGVLIRDLRKGTGASPKPMDTIRVHYHGTRMDDTVFDSSVQRGAPIVFPLRNLIPCWKQALLKMKTGGKAHLVCPAVTAYGERGSPPKIGPGEALNFEVELIAIEKK
jgi:FKBP-type peptidyl-prolyl cis-trans isomerase FkpA